MCFVLFLKWLDQLAPLPAPSRIEPIPPEVVVVGRFRKLIQRGTALPEISGSLTHRSGLTPSLQALPPLLGFTCFTQTPPS